MEFKQIKKYTQNLKVLFIEDNIDFMKETMEILNIFFDDVDIALDGEGGLDMYKQRYYQDGSYYDLIITDINMPNMSGDELIKEMKKLNQNQSIIVLSAHSEEDKLISFIKNGVKDFIKKPIVTIELQDILYRVCKDIVIQKDEKQEIAEIKKENKETTKLLLGEKANLLDNKLEFDINDLLY